MKKASYKGNEKKPSGFRYTALKWYLYYGIVKTSALVDGYLADFL
jgi:hypothetical protein